MKKALLLIPLCIGIAVVFAADTATTPSESFEKKYANATEAQLLDALNKLSASVISDGRVIRERQQTLGTVWRDADITSPEIDELRKKVNALEDELQKARAALKEAIDQHPEVQLRRNEIEGDIRKNADSGAELAYIRKRLQTIRQEMRMNKQPE